MDSEEQVDDDESMFLILLLAIIIGWILVALWTRFIENFAFGTLGFNSDSAWHSLLVALGVSLFFIIFVWVVDRYAIVPGGLVNDFSSSAEIESPDFVSQRDVI